MNPPEQPEARLDSATPRGQLDPRIRSFLEQVGNPQSTPAPDSPETKERTQRILQAEQGMLKVLNDPSSSPMARRRAIADLYGGRRADELSPLHYGEWLLSRIQTLYRSPSFDNLRKSRQGLSWNDDESEAGQLVEDIFNTETGGLHIPRIAPGMDNDAVREEIVSKHRYFTIQSPGGYMGIRALHVRRDLEKVNTFRKAVRVTSPNDVRKHVFLDDLAVRLQEIQECDVASYNQEGIARPEQHLSPQMEHACNSAKILIIIILAFMATMSLIVERRKRFPLVTVLYAGLAALIMSPSLFRGRMEQVQRSLGFVHTSQWDLFVSRYRARVTGQPGEQFMQAMMQEHVQEAGRELAGARQPDHETYFKRIASLGMREEHVKLLRDIRENDQRNGTGYFTMIVGHTSTITGPEEQLMLANFARHGMDATAFRDLHSNDRPGAGPRTGDVPRAT